MRQKIGETLVIASHNAGKLKEIETLVSPFEIKTRSVAEWGLPEPLETGTSFEENAYIKAYAAAKSTGFAALSDDSGLMVDALDGAPGVYSADWAIDARGKRDFLMAMEKVEQALRVKGAEAERDRIARFVCVLCLCWPDGTACSFRGVVEGHIIWPPRGDQGFGYDPIFQPRGFTRSFGEMTAEEKHGWKDGKADALSHRSRAFALFVQSILSVS